MLSECQTTIVEVWMTYKSFTIIYGPSKVMYFINVINFVNKIHLIQETSSNQHNAQIVGSFFLEQWNIIYVIIVQENTCS